MDTAQTVLSLGATTTRSQSLLPWIIGGLVVIAVLYLIYKL